MALAQSEIKQRVQRAQDLMIELDIDLAIITPGINFRYLTNQQAVALERLTALVISQQNQWLLVPHLEFHQAQELHQDIEVLSWQETEDPYQICFSLSANAKNIALDDKMPFFHVARFQKSLDVKYHSFAIISEQLRSVKSPAEIRELELVSAAINRVHSKITDLKFLNRTEKDLAKEIKDLILLEHQAVDFVIVAAGTNSANPHHQVGERVIASGDVIVIDIGGTSSSGYCSDCTRTYAVNKVDKQFEASFDLLLRAQQLGVDLAQAGLAAEQLDGLVREELAKNDLAQWFSHRLGHGIGMETHETPYLVSGNKQILKPGNVFSIEPGFYIPGKWGARIEDIVALTDTGLINLNNFEHNLRIVS